LRQNGAFEGGRLATLFTIKPWAGIETEEVAGADSKQG